MPKDEKLKAKVLAFTSSKRMLIRPPSGQTIDIIISVDTAIKWVSHFCNTFYFPRGEEIGNSIGKSDKNSVMEPDDKHDGDDDDENRIDACLVLLKRQKTNN